MKNWELVEKLCEEDPDLDVSIEVGYGVLEALSVHRDVNNKVVIQAGALH